VTRAEKFQEKPAPPKNSERNQPRRRDVLSGEPPAAAFRDIPQEVKMNWDQVEGNWKKFKGMAQQQWGKLTNDDLDVIEGKRMELVGRLQERYGYAKDEAEREIDSWLNRK
jgi:uncharacterized protein YjbJ (UPF0337 family)